MLNTDSVTSIKIDDGTIVNADINDSAAIAMSKLALSITNSEVNASAAIAGSKISPNFGSQNIITTGQIKVDGDGGSKYVSVGDNEDFKIYHDATGPTIFSDANNQGLKIQAKNLNFTENTGVTTRLRINDDGHVDIIGNLDVGAGIDVTGDIITTSGNLTVDGTGSVEDVFKISDAAGGQRLLMGNRDSAGVDCPRIFNVGNAALTIGIGDSWSGDGGTLTNQFHIAKNGVITSYGNHDFGAGIDVTGAITGTTSLIGTTTYGGGGAAPALYVSNTGGRQVKIHNPNAGTSSLQITNATTGQGEDAGTQLFTQATTGDFHTINKFVTGDIAFTTTVSGPTSEERMRIDSAGTIFSFSPDDTTPNIKFRSDDTNWFGSLNQSVEGATISTFLSTGGDWSANGTTYSATKAIASFETRAIVLHPQFNNGAGKVAFLQKAAGSTTTDGTVTEILSIDNDGIKFGGETAANHALDDYEEGTFTPTCQSGGFNNWDTNSGRYTKIGRLVHVYWENSFDGTGDGTTLIIGGLPFVTEDWAAGSMYAGAYTQEGTHLATPAVANGTATVKVILWGSEATGNMFSSYSAWNLTYTTTS